MNVPPANAESEVWARDEAEHQVDCGEGEDSTVKRSSRISHFWRSA